MFKTGDTIKCINNTEYEKVLTKNKLYTVIESETRRVVRIKNNQNKEFTFYYRRFILDDTLKIKEYGIVKFIKNLEKK